MKNKCEKTGINNVCFEYNNHMIVSNSVNEVKNWIDSLPGLTCNEKTERNLENILNKVWVSWGAYNQNISPLNDDGFRLRCLKTTGIRTGEISFHITNCTSVDEVIAERAAYAKRIADAKLKITEISNDLGAKLLKKLSKKSNSCVDMIHSGALQFILRIGQLGFWINDPLCNHWHYVEEYYTHFDGETLITDEGKNVIDVLNQFLNEN